MDGCRAGCTAGVTVYTHLLKKAEEDIFSANVTLQKKTLQGLKSVIIAQHGFPEPKGTSSKSLSCPTNSP